MFLHTRRSVNEHGPSLRTRRRYAPSLHTRRRYAPSLHTASMVVALLTLGVVASLVWLVGTL
jgi:hypothetical protein